MGLFLGADELNCNLANKYKSGPQIDIFDCYVYVFSNEQFTIKWRKNVLRNFFI